MVRTDLFPRLPFSLLPTASLICVVVLSGCGASAVGDDSLLVPPEVDASPSSDTGNNGSIDTTEDRSDLPVVDPCEEVVCDPGQVCQGAGQCVSTAVDTDRDGYEADNDCDDFDPAINPGAAEVCDGRDNNCDSQVDEGFDGDSDGFPTCSTRLGPPDCDDSQPGVNPGATEVCDGRDNNCNLQVDEGFDADGDGYVSCSTGSGPVDCDDGNSRVHPGASEVCDGEDNNCNNSTDEGSVCIGCSDGARDQLADSTRWPGVAACEGTFARMSLRAPRTNTACGDDLDVPCPAPEDLCAAGWHICMRNGYSGDLRTRLDPADCRALTKTFVAATNNCGNPNTENPSTTSCNVTEPYGCYSTGWCSAPVACGPSETSHCAHAVWPTQTRIFGLHTGRTVENGCASISTSVDYSHLDPPASWGTDQGSLAGVLCCSD